MKETTFINKNKEKWKRFEKLSKGNNTDPEELGELFTEVNEDLSFAQTFYERRTVRAYLNQAAQGVYGRLYKQKGDSLKKYWKTWSIVIPLELYKSRKNLLFALVMFMLWVVIGAITTHYFPDFVDMAAGRGMIARGERFIGQDDPFGFYGDSGSFEMFYTITLNNIKVAFLCFLGGILFSFGTHYLVFKNGMMLGSFQYFYVLKGLGLSSFLAIWIHGAFEISAIVVAAGAGFTLGHSLLFPGSYSRLQSFQLGAKRSMRIMIALVPVFIIAGFLESYVTRNYASLPDWSKWCIIIFSFALMLIYFVIYPQYLARKHPELLQENESVNQLPSHEVSLYKIRNFTDIISDTFQLYRQKFYVFMKINLSITLPLMLLLSGFQFITHSYDFAFEYPEDWINLLSILFGNPYGQTFIETDFFALFLWVLPLTSLASAVYYAISSASEKFVWKNYFSFLSKQGFKVFVGIAIFYAFMVILPSYLIWAGIFIVPFLFNVLSLGVYDQKGLGLGKFMKYGAKSWVFNFVLVLFLSAMVILFAQPIAFVMASEDINEIPDLLDVFTDFIRMILADETPYTIEIVNGIRVFVYLIFILLVFPLVLIASALSSYKSIEEEEAPALRKEFERFGKRSRTVETKGDYE
ncbi:stage II sporulation protein M [Lishizhenia sp.]|uniref:stage II sporulation protein M n=1 Tax=Lishizhenia sp. TaxID=2497594 RepID=UPI00299EA1B8|nr:stage II sporulation protein M [Lishizhenia sp.]MDX1445814.1 stage II sporulation protein M [Lishizhenia sp.]